MLNNKRAVNESVARAFCSAGIPFAVANNPHVKQAFMDVAMPSEFMLRTSLLTTEVNRLKHDIDTKIMSHLSATVGPMLKTNHLSTTTCTRTSSQAHKC